MVKIKVTKFLIIGYKPLGAVQQWIQQFFLQNSLASPYVSKFQYFQDHPALFFHLMSADCQILSIECPE